MNSWVLNPCRCVVFFVFIPKAAAPSASGLRRCAVFATLTRLRVSARADCEDLRLAREEVLPSGSCGSNSSSDDDEFSLPLLSRGIHASFDGSSETPRKNMLPVGSRPRGVIHCVALIYHIFRKNQS